MDMSYDYDVFLSYRHKPLDAAITQKAFHALESYNLPRIFRKSGFSAVRRVFRDTEELAVSRILSNTIEEALRSSNCLVVVCSSDTPSSEWVDREVAAFVELGRSDKIYPLLIAGGPEESYPPALNKIPDIENRVLDARVTGDDPKKIKKRMKAALLPVVARISGIPHRELARRDKMRSVSNALATRLGAVCAFTLVMLVCRLLWASAVGFRQDAQRDQSASMAILKTLTYSLPDALVELPGTYDATAAILEANSLQINDILALSADKERVLPEVASNDERCATSLLKLAGYDRAADYQLRAISVYRHLVEDGFDEYVLRLASAMNNLGVTLEATGDYSGASQAYRDAIATGLSASEESSASAASELEFAAYTRNLAICEFMLGDSASAEYYLGQANSALQSLYSDGYGPATRALGTNLNNLGVLLYSRGQYQQAEQTLNESARLAAEAFRETPNRTLLGELVRSQSSLAICYSLQAKFGSALSLYEQAIGAQELLASDAGNIEAQNALAILCNNTGTCYNAMGQFAPASEYYRRSVDILDGVNERHGTPLTQAVLARACYNVAENAFKGGEYELSRQFYERCLELYAPVSEALGNYHRGEYLARLAYYQIIFDNDFPAALGNAAAAADMLPDSSFALYILGYALMYNGYAEASSQILSALAERSEGEANTIRLDFEALARAGLAHPRMPAVLEEIAAVHG